MRERIVTCLEREYPQRKRERESRWSQRERERIYGSIQIVLLGIQRDGEYLQIHREREREPENSKRERERESKYPQLQRAKASCRQQAAKSPRCGYECRQGEWNVGPPTGPLVLSPFISGKGQELSEMPVWR